jgi:hypothetical protein
MILDRNLVSASMPRGQHRPKGAMKSSADKLLAYQR